MSICKAGAYTNNIVVTHHPLFCFGGLGEAPCQYLSECMTEHDIKLKRHNKRQNKSKA